MSNSAPLNKEQETRMRLILAGEKLIGELGVDGVSLRQVNTEAGQKNKSAAHYHFGTKFGLIQAIYDYRMARVNNKREQMLAQKNSTVRDLVAAWVYPMVEEMYLPDTGTYYIRFIAKVSSHPENDIRRLMESSHASGLNLIAKALRKQLSLPEKIFAMRFGLVMTQVIHGLAEHERLIHISSDKHLIDTPLFLSNLVDLLTASLTADISAETNHELTKNNEARA